MLGRTDIIKKLLEEVWCSLSDAKDDRHVQYSDFLNGCHPNVGTFLHEAVRHEKRDVVRALLSEGSDPGALDEDQDTALDLASSSEMRQVFADVLIQSAANSGQIEQMARLLKAGIDISVIDTPTTRNTVLHWAATFGSAMAVQLLLEQFGADPNLTNTLGMTALHDAVSRKDSEIVQILIKFGANPTIKSTKDGLSPLDMAEAKKLSEISQILKTSSYLHQSAQNNLNGKSTEDQNSISASPETLSSPLRSPLSPVPPVITDERFNLLCPQPKQIHQLSDEQNFFPDRMTISISPGRHSIHDVLDVWDIYRGLFMRIKRRIHLSESQPRNCKEAHIHCTLNKNLFQTRPGYKLTISNHRIKILASDTTGLRHAISTLIQIFSLFYPSSSDGGNNNHDAAVLNGGLSQSEDEEYGITSVSISDWPDFAMRAVLLDLNPYGRVPKMDTMLGIIDVLSLIKINQFHIFFRVGSTDASYLCYCKRDYMTLDRYTTERGISLVPSVDVDASIETLEDLSKIQQKLREILRCFDHPKFIHLGPKITSLLLPNNENDDISIRDYIPAPIGDETTFLLCANSLQSKNQRNKLPENSIAVQYGFQKNEAFTNALSGYVHDGQPVAICCGTNAWSNFAGNPDMAFKNMFSAVKAIRKFSGVGFLTANWSSHPSMTHVSFAWPAFLMTASLGWNSATPESYLRMILPSLLDAHVFGACGWNLDGTRSDGCETSPGRSLIDLGMAEETLDLKLQIDESDKNVPVTQRSASNSLLLRILISTNDVVFNSLTIEDFGVALQGIKKAQTSLVKSSSHIKNPRTHALNQEIFLTAELLILAARIGRALIANPSPNESKVVNVGVSNLPPTFRTDIANKALTLVEQFRALWLSRYEPQGMQSSLLVLSNLLSTFIPDGAQTT